MGRPEGPSAGGERVRDSGIKSPKAIIAKVKGAIKKMFDYIEPLPVLNPPDYLAVSAEILAEIARIHRPIRARHSTTRRVIVESLHYDYSFHSYLGGRVLLFENLMECREVSECVNRMNAYTKKGFEFIVVSPTVLWSRVRGKHFL